ncbi:putative zinc metalloprotease Rip2 [Beijerinckiaceae bacterium RH AL1]|nr:site-2 protease family protein [Beijerinckiaceae bacterium]VVB44611.1 putative zinc metalloprotease Rip2 [Beijerinckiaceae bacterium RH CH11]VVB44689.1 putative zinc metalloprotease Rip2 [Beijerinckiaceae bacterium RH AL8]VVC54446.1 putative zinc metalloprotease Rip2 [Beijerinckiaceae bacterium RH AL1]
MRAAIEPSFNFLVLVLVFTGTGSALWNGWVDGPVAVLVLVVSGWVVSLCLHEFGHALTAYLGGDGTVAATGYLTLDPLKYTDPVLSLILPVIYLFFGGFGLPGGAVYVRTDLLRSAGWASAVSAAGPFATLCFLLLLAALIAVAPVSADGDVTDLRAGLAVLAFFQATALVLNLLPFPGLDGFGIVRPFLPPSVAVATRRAGNGVFILLILALWYTPLGGAVFRLGLEITHALEIPLSQIARGFRMIRFIRL